MKSFQRNQTTKSKEKFIKGCDNNKRRNASNTKKRMRCKEVDENQQNEMASHTEETETGNQKDKKQQSDRTFIMRCVRDV